MTTPEPFLQATSELSLPPPATPPICLPADGLAASPLRDRPWARRAVDAPLAIVVLAFAFLAASFAARNSDFWLHLAAGRLLAEGRYSFGVEPFAYTTANVYWTNHAWLFDRVLYGLYRLDASGGVLVVLKALLVAVLAAVLLSVRRPGGRLALPAACTLLAVLAMSPRLLLHSTCLSYVFLGLTLWLLWRPHTKPAALASSWKHYAPLLLLFVLWVNVDDWFLLGPLVAALFWLGNVVLPDRSAGEDHRRMPAWLWLAGLAVCLVNPHLWHAFVLPADLLPLPAALRDDPRFAPLSNSSWQLVLYHPAAGVNLSSAAYLLLLVLGLLSFLLRVRHIVGWRLLVWLTFAGLSAWLARAVPFFAVVGGPIAALNLQDALSAQGETRSGKKLFALGTSYFVLFASGLMLTALAWAGWLQGFGDTGHHVDWAVRPNGSLQRGAETLRQWREQGKLGDNDRGFPVHPSVVHYCAWFCPAEKGFLDARASLFAGVADDFEEICRAVNPSFGAPTSDWRQILTRHGITHLILYEADPGRLLAALQRVDATEHDWTLLDIDGQALLVGWKDKDRSLPHGVPAFDADRLAFTSGGEETLPAAPARGPERGPRAADFWSHFGRAVPPASWETDAAGVLLSYFGDRTPMRQRDRFLRCLGWEVGVRGQPALLDGALAGALRLAVQLAQAPFAPADVNQQPPAALLLAVRAARTAVANNPDDAVAWLQLGRAYGMLAGLTPERVVLPAFEPLVQVRQIQIAVALENALRRNPDLFQAHQDLANLYEGRNFLDAALDHRREALRLVRRDGAYPGESAEAFAARLEAMEKYTRELQRLVSDRKNEFALRARKAGSEPYRKAQLARQMGLGRLALDDILLQSTMVLLGGEGIRLEAELMLEMGRIEPVRERLNSADWQANKKNLGVVEVPAPAGSGAAPQYELPAYDWLWLCQAAAAGDYDEADEAVRALIDGLGGKEAAEHIASLRRALLRVLPLEIALSANNLNWWLRGNLANDRQVLANVMGRASHALTEQADIHAITGMLRLERGDPRGAEKAFEQALTLARLGASSPHPSAGQPLARVYLQLLRQR